MSLWYYGTPDGQRGPVEEEELRGLIASGVVQGSTLVWRDGMGNWQPLNTIPGLGGQVSPYGQPPVGSYLPRQYSGQALPGYYQAPPANGLAVASMVCGILGFMTCISCIPAVICGHMALSKIKASPFESGGKGMAIAGLVMGYLVSIILLLYIGFIAFAIIATPHHP